MLSRVLPRRCLSSAHHLRNLRIQTASSRAASYIQHPTHPSVQRTLPHPHLTARTFATTSSRLTEPFDQALVEQKMEEITDLYGTARDEFEIAAEETVKKTVYAEDDRAAAREELDKLKEAYEAVIEGSDRGVAEEVKRRVGNRVRELESAVVAMEEAALEE